MISPLSMRKTTRRLTRVGKGGRGPALGCGCYEEEGSVEASTGIGGSSPVAFVKALGLDPDKGRLLPHRVELAGHDLARVAASEVGERSLHES